MFLQPVSRLPDLPRMRGRAAAARGARRPGRRTHHRRRLCADRARCRCVLRRPGAVREGGGDRRQGAAGNPQASRVPARCRPRLPDARSPVVDAVGRRVAADQSGDVARIGAGRHALRARRAVDRPAFARQRAPHRHPAQAARSGQHRAGRRARRRHDQGRRHRRRHGARRGGAGRPGGLLRHAARRCCTSRAR